MKNGFLTLAWIVSVSVGVMGCDKDNDEDENRCVPVSEVSQAQVMLAFKDATGKYLYSEVNPSYHKDSLKIFDLQGNRMNVLSSLEQVPGGATRYWKMTLKPVYHHQTDAAAFLNQVCRTFVVKYTHTTTDTLSACFKAKQTDECSSIFESFKVFQKDALLGSVTNSNSISVSPVKE